jgi:hypothetical protein
MKTMTSLFQINIRQSSIFHTYLLAVVLALTGCATGHTRVDLSTIEAPPPEKAMIFIIRPNHTFCAGINFSITANDTKIAVLSNLSYTSILMAPGKLKLSADGFGCPHKEITIDVAGGQTYYAEWNLADSLGLAMLIPIAGYAKGMEDTHWDLLTKESAQELLKSTNYVKPIVEESP